MDTEAYKKQFLSEARDSLEDLNSDLVELEKGETDDLINKIFRSFHTLKGNSATMGFMKFSEISHDLENLLDKVRNKELSLDSETVDVLLDGLDVLNDGLDLIEKGHSEELDITDVVRAVKEKMGGGQSVQIDHYEPPAQLDLDTHGRNSVRVLTRWSLENQLRLLKSRLVQKKLSSVGEIIFVKPNIADQSMSSDKLGEFVDFVIATEQSESDVRSAISSIVGIEMFVGNPHEAMEIPKLTHQTEEHEEKQKKEITDKHLGSAIKKVNSVKVSTEQLDTLMNLVGELLIVKMRMQTLSSVSQNKEMQDLVTGLDRLTNGLQDTVMQTRMVPVSYVFNKFPRMVRDLAKKQEKDIDLIMEGQDMELDRTVLDQIGDPLVHLLRNSVDHGIESSDQRVNSGKEEKGQVKLIARREENHAVIEIIDDGAGIDPAVVKASCVSKGIITQDEANKMSDEEAQRLIFKPSVSTNKVVTEVSGRGVGMDVVETKIKSLGGNVKLFSEIGKGTTIALQLPLTVAIITSLLVKVGDNIYGIPLSAILRTVHINKEELKHVQNETVFTLGEEVIAYVDLRKEFGEEAVDRSLETVIIVEKGNQKLGLLVDDVVAQQEILIKSLDRHHTTVKGITGATILGDGSVALIVDVNAVGEK